MTEWYFIVCMYYFYQFLHCFYEHTGCFHFLAIVTTKNTGIDTPLQHTDFIPFSYALRSEIVESYGTSSFNFKKKPSYCSHNVFTNAFIANELIKKQCENSIFSTFMPIWLTLVF